MPFTVSHIVAAIPFDKKFGIHGALSALIIGSMTPDISYLLPFLLDNRMESHSLIGIYLFCIPMGLTVYFLYHLLMAPVWCSFLPNSVQLHLSPELLRGKIPVTQAHIVILSIVIGALTHVVWDFFTHDSGIGQYITWLNTPLTSIDGFIIMPHRVLQHISSAVGLGLLIYWIRKWYRSKQHELKNELNKNDGKKYWQAPKKLRHTAFILIVVSTVSYALLSGYWHLPETDILYGMFRAHEFVRFAIVGGATAFICSSCVLGLFYQLIISKDNL